MRHSSPATRILRFLVITLIVVNITGCGTIMRNLQYSDIRTGLFPMKMTLTLGRGKVDARPLIKAQTYEGSVTCGEVTAHYPAGMKSKAQTVAEAFEAARIKIKARTGITWAFKPDLYLVPVQITSDGLYLQLPIRKSRTFQLPILVSYGHEPFVLPEWTEGIAHELTEASMLSSLNRRELVLGDYPVGGKGGLINRTRWFRDGVAEYAGEILNQELFGERYQPSWWIYQELAGIRGDVLEWNNCSYATDYQYYNASEALVRVLINHSGEDTIARVMQAASTEKYIDGDTLDRAVKKVTGLDLKEFVHDYHTQWLGMDLKDTRPLTGAPLMTRVDNQVQVLCVYPGTPAEKWKLQPGDVIVMADGYAVPSKSWFIHYINALQPGARLTLDLSRNGTHLTYRMKLTTRRADGSRLQVSSSKSQVQG